jgi:[acyl-carrier-protein] S-malonyltransferase
LKKFVFLFPGQGSQSVGMARDFYDRFDFVRSLFDTAGQITGIDMADLCFNGPMAKLTRTEHLQPAVTTVNLAILGALAREGFRADFTAGHSLGEFSALCAAGVITPDTALRLVDRRAHLMARDAKKAPGVMHAVIGLSRAEVAALVADAGRQGVVGVANYNGPEQVVITGAPEPVQTVAARVAEKGGRSLPLKVSGAWHSPLMTQAGSDFAEILDGVDFQPPESAIALNATGEFCADPVAIRDIMGRQICSPVRWHDAMLRILGEAPDVYVEIGPGKVLAGLLRRILPRGERVPVFCLNSLRNFEQFLAAMG